MVFRIPIGHRQGRSEVNFGFCFKLSRSGSVVSWASKKQGCVALSSCEAEYVSLALAAQEAVCLQGLKLVEQLLMRAANRKPGDK